MGDGVKDVLLPCLNLQMLAANIRAGFKRMSVQAFLMFDTLLANTDMES